MNDKEPALLEMNNISKIYGNGVYANRDVTFSVCEGEIHALVGENGAGKSTLMKILFGLEKPSSGQIVLHGEPVVFRSPQDAIARGIGMVHQHFKLVDSLSITENVTMGYEPMRRGFINRGEAEKRVAEIAGIFALKDSLSTPVGQLPVGTKQKVEIIKALYRGAKILILDEPTAVLTPQETAELFVQLKDLKTKGYTVIFISHKLREVKELSDRISVMRQGKLVDTCQTDGVTEQDISEKMVGRSYSAQLDKKPAAPGEVCLAVSGLVCRGRGGKPAVNDISFTVRAGEIVGVAGVEGNGQNELVAALVGLRRHDGGTIRFFGRDTTGLSVEQLRRLGMSYIPSDRMDLGLATSMTIEENLITTKLDDRSLYQGGLLSRKKTLALSRGLIDTYTVKCDSPETEIGMLSGGNMQKVVVAREFTMGSRLIIAEQPTRGIDVGAAKFIHEELLRLRDAGCAVLMISADLEELYQLSDSIFVMYDGQISAYLKDPSTVSENELGYYMLGVHRQSDSEIREAYYEKEKSSH
jgi:general nucleoside transport system ATP-binding protein